MRYFAFPWCPHQRLIRIVYPPWWLMGVIYTMIYSPLYFIACTVVYPCRLLRQLHGVKKRHQVKAEMTRMGIRS